MSSIRVGSKYQYQPVGMDTFDPPHGVEAGFLKPGDTVKTVNLPGCPKGGTMGMYFIEKDGQFAGLVCKNSLVPVVAAKKQGGNDYCAEMGKSRGCAEEMG